MINAEIVHAGWLQILLLQCMRPFLGLTTATNCTPHHDDVTRTCPGGGHVTGRREWLTFNLQKWKRKARRPGSRLTWRRAGLARGKQHQQQRQPVVDA